VGGRGQKKEDCFSKKNLQKQQFSGCQVCFLSLKRNDVQYRGREKEGRGGAAEKANWRGDNFCPSFSSGATTSKKRCRSCQKRTRKKRGA